MAKVKKETKKKQGDEITGTAMSATNEFPPMRQLQRGLGTAYAMAVTTLLDHAHEIAGGKNPFLGHKSELLDPNEYGAHSLIYGPGLKMKDKE